MSHCFSCQTWSDVSISTSKGEPMSIYDRIQRIALAKLKSLSSHSDNLHTSPSAIPTLNLELPEEVLKDLKTLEVSTDATLAELDNSYKRLAKKYHPDRFANDAQKQKQANQLMGEINGAYQRLKEKLT